MIILTDVLLIPVLLSALLTLEISKEAVGMVATNAITAQVIIRSPFCVLVCIHPILINDFLDFLSYSY